MAEQDALTELLTQEERNLMERLEAVRKLLGKGPLLESRTLMDREAGRSTKAKHVKPKPKGIPKAGETWEEYIVTVLKALGGRGKSMDVITYAMGANPRMPEKKVREAVRGKMSKMAKAGRIGAIRTNVKTEGYEYVVLEGHTKNDPKVDSHGVNDNGDLD